MDRATRQHRPTRLGRALALACVWVTSAAVAAATPAPPASGVVHSSAAAVDPAVALEHMAHVISQAGDDPRASMQRTIADTDAASADPARRFWNQLTQARVRTLLEQAPDAERALAQARRSLEAWGHVGALPGLALELQELDLAMQTQDAVELRPRTQALLERIRATGNRRLICNAVAVHAFVLTEASEVSDAWDAAKEVATCAQALGDVPMHAGAYLQMGAAAAKALARIDGGKTPATYFQHALEVLGDQPARYLRSIIEWEIGKSLTHESPASFEHFERARELSRQIGDEVGVAVVDIDIAFARLAAGQPKEALARAREARATLLREGAHARVLSTYSSAIGALADLGSHEVLGEIEAARRWELPSTSPHNRGHLARQMARGYAAIGDYRRAYEEQQRSDDLAAQARNDRSNRELLHLRARYESAQREAENAQLRLHGESARHQLDAARARQQAMWLALVALVIALSAAAMATVRILRERRQMADLALRDELTGAPNRRAVTAIAQTQWTHCRRLQVPLSVAVLDLDHFKRINDTYGHDVGDAALRAFAAAAMPALRTHDRLGRWGGEEWLLVAPGAQAAQLEAIFQRIRQCVEQTPVEGMPFPHGITFSMGGACTTEARPADLEALIHQADQQLYRAKQQGRDRSCVAN